MKKDVFKESGQDQELAELKYRFQITEGEAVSQVCNSFSDFSGTTEGPCKNVF